MKDIAKIRINASHFIIAICLFTVLLNILEKQKMKQYQHTNSESYLVELNDEDLLNSSVLEDCYLFFHLEDSEYSERMMANFNSFVKDKQDETGFYTVNLDKHPELYTKFNISGAPSILIFKNGKEVKRILGVVPKRNLEKIYNIMNVLRDSA